MKYMYVRKRIGKTAVIGAVMLSMILAAGQTAGAQEVSPETAAEQTAEAAGSSAEEDAVTEGVYEDSSDGGHAIEADGVKASYSGISVKKTGEADGDEADFYGENAAIYASNGAELELTDITVETDGTHANGVFSYGEGTTVTISDSVIETSGNCSGGLMTTGGGTLDAENLTVHTTGNSSAAIRSDRGGGTENVTGGVYTTEGTGSPVIYSTADVTVTDAEMKSTASQGVVVEGKNSVTLNDVTLTADNNTQNSDKSDWYQAVMIYQSMSGDAAEGEASFTMNGGSLVNKNGDVFFVNNTIASITLSGAEIVNEDADGVFLRAAAAGWGREGSNGGHVTLNAQDQMISGDLLVDEVSSLNLYLVGTSVMESALNPDGEAGGIYVEIGDDAVWKLTGDSYITSLTCDADAIDLNGFRLYVSGKEYEAGSASEGEAIEVEVSSSGGRDGRPEGGPENGKGGGPDGMKGRKGGNGQPPEPPEGFGDGNGQPPEPPEGFGDGSGQPPEPPEGIGGERPELPDEDGESQTPS